MSAETLREAAQEIRAEWADDLAPHPMGTAWLCERLFMLAIADMLERSARVFPIGDDGQPLILTGSTYEAAIDVARAYLGETS